MATLLCVQLNRSFLNRIFLSWMYISKSIGQFLLLVTFSATLYSWYFENPFGGNVIRSHNVSKHSAPLRKVFPSFYAREIDEISQFLLQLQIEANTISHQKINLSDWKWINVAKRSIWKLEINNMKKRKTKITSST